MSKDIVLSVVVSDGKYTFISYAGDYRITCLRHGKPWMVFEKGHKAILALMFEADTLKAIDRIPDLEDDGDMSLGEEQAMRQSGAY